MLREKAFAKINLTLDVLYKREDGYHEVAMVMQSIDLADNLSLFLRDDGKITLATDSPGLDTGPGNLAYRAAALLREITGVTGGVHIELNKNIPLAAGLAGGSADAAAALRGLNRLWGLDLSLDELAAIGARIGSDVPFCLYGGTMLATGRGEKLAPLPAMPPCWVVLAKPPVDVATAWVYQNYRPDAAVVHPDLAGMKAALAAGDFRGIASRLGNVLETVTAGFYPEIDTLKKMMLEYGATASLMSGSGPTVFGLVEDYANARQLAAALAARTTARIMLAKVVGGENGTQITADKTR